MRAYHRDPAAAAAWFPSTRRSRPRGTPSRGRSFPVTIVRVETDEGVIGVGSGDTMDGFEAYEHLFVGQDPLAIARHVRVLETIDFHAGRYWPLEAALWDIAGQVAGLPVATLFGGRATGSRPTPRAGCCCRRRAGPSPRCDCARRGSAR